MGRAKVIFTDGFNTSVTVETDNQNLKDRLRKANLPELGPSLKATRFIIQSVAIGIPAVAMNTPTGRTHGGTVTNIQNEEFWPDQGREAGVFFVNSNHCVEVWGGSGFEGQEEFTPNIPLEVKLEAPSEEGDNPQ